MVHRCTQPIGSKHDRAPLLCQPRRSSFFFRTVQKYIPASEREGEKRERHIVSPTGAGSSRRWRWDTHGVRWRESRERDAGLIPIMNTVLSGATREPNAPRTSDEFVKISVGPATKRRTGERERERGVGKSAERSVGRRRG